MENVISVIIPVYNVQTYLPECLDSLIAQDYQDLEIILIDDGSKDNSGKICDEYAAKDSRIKVIHQPNGGAGAAKNAGLKAATGEYLAFLDSDDFLEPGAYSHMMAILKEQDADIVQCAFQRLFRDGAKPERMANLTAENTEACMARVPWDWTLALLWNKLYRRSIFDGIFFEVGNIIDDEYFTYQGIMNAKKIVYDDRVVHNYRQRRSSVMNSPQSRVRILKNWMEFQNIRRKKVSARFPQLRRLYYTAYIDYLIQLTKNPWHTEETMKILKQAIADYLREPNWVRPGILLLPKFAYVCLASEEFLLRRIRRVENTADVENLYP